MPLPAVGSWQLSKSRSWLARRRKVSTLLALALATLSFQAVAQQRTLRDQLVGAWAYVSVETVRTDGSRTPMYGPHPQGIAIFDATGRYALINARADLPKFASGNRTAGSPAEYRAIVHGSIAHFGSYAVDESGRTITFHIETSTFPNWNGVEQKRPFTLVGDNLKWTTPAASGGGSGEIVLRRLKWRRVDSQR